MLCLTAAVLAVVATVGVRKWRSRPEAAGPLQRGRLLWKSGCYDEAIAAFEAARAADPDDPVALRGLAECYKGKGQLATAAVWAERAAGLDPTPRSHLLAAEIALVAGGKWTLLEGEARAPTEGERLYLEKAREHAKAAVEKDSAFGPAYRALAEATARLGDVPKAVDHIRKAVEKDPDARATRLAAIELLALDGKPQEALTHSEYLVRLLEARPKLPAQQKAELLHALRRGAEISVDLKRFDAAVGLWGKFLAHGGDRGEMHVGMAACYLRKGDLERSVAEADLAGRFIPPASPESNFKHRALHRVRGVALLKLQRYDRAAVDLRLAATADRSDPASRYMLGLALLGSGQRDAALDAFLEALAADPKCHAARRELVQILEARGEADKALAELREAASVAPDDPEPQQMMADFCMRRGLRNEAREALGRLLRLRPGSASAAAQLCQLHLDGGDAEKALLVARQAAPAEPADPELLLLQARAEAALGRTEEATAHFELAVRDQPALADAYIEWAAMQEAAGDPAAAQETLERGLKAAPRSAALRCAHARFSIAAGREKEGVAELEAILKEDPRQLPAHAMLIGHLLARGDAKGALAQAGAAAAALPDSVEALMLLARTQHSCGEWDVCISTLNHVATALGGEALALPKLLAAHVHQGHYKVALEMGRSALDRSPSLRAALVPILSVAEFLGGSRDEAIEAVSRVASADPLDCNAGFMLSLMQLAKGDPVLSAPACREYALPAVALAAWTELVALAKDNPAKARRIAEMLLLAHVYESVGWHDTAAQKAAEVLQFAPDCLMASSLVPILWERAGQRAKAIAACESAMERCKSFAYGRHVLADLLLLDGQTGRAAALCKEAAAGEVGSYDARSKLALLAAATGDDEEALRHWRAILAYEPRHMPACNNAAWLMANQPLPDLAEAAAAAANALDGDRTNPAVLDTVGWVSCLRGETQRAVDLLEEAAAAAPQHARYLFHLGMAYARHGQAGNAARMLRRAVDSAPFAAFADEARRTLRDLHE